ncbi:MAG: phosphoenolpyruvate synthase [Alphaproteobacteria bacterium]|nr:phosphoenolpyruvate synthase [Alphaproteobacteria bacterium]
MSVIAFGTKATTLERVAPRLTSAVVPPSYHFTVAQWRSGADQVTAGLRARTWSGRPLIVRSSGLAEDGASGSLAGHFVSVADVSLAQGFDEAVARVVAAFDGGDDQVLVQPMLERVAASGVAFSRDPSTRAPYIVVNWEEAGDTGAVTGGREARLSTHVHWKEAPPPPDARLAAVIRLLRELETLFGHDSLDIEFAFGADGTLYLLQVRPLVIPGEPIAIEPHRRLLERIAERVAVGMRPDPFIHGRRTVYGVMPDWNPAEIIGVRPRPLALSLYRDLITDATWAYQRNNYGYKNLRGCPLLVHFHGLPYIDVRVSFNSFVPADIEDDLADRLVNYYIDRLVEAPHLHDKVEFDIIFSCYTPLLPESIGALKAHGFRDGDLTALEHSLRRLTNNIIHHKRGLWRGDLEKLTVLERRRERLNGADADPVTRIHWLLEDCKRYGSLPFAGLARAGFIAVQLLRSLVSIGVLSGADYQAFMTGLNSVGAQMRGDRLALGREPFLARYGHLRPGTYDILSPRYDEAPDLYFDWATSAAAPERERPPPFVLSLEQMRAISRLLEAHGLENDIVAFFDFLAAGIEGREYAKFVFTRNLSDALSLFRRYGESLGLTAEALSYADIGVMREIYLSSVEPRPLIEASIEQGRARHELSRQIVLPPLITGRDDVWSFRIPEFQPNFITLKSATGPVVAHRNRDELAGAIVCIPNADPGFDWLFAHPIAGLVTAYGGVNSHMAIRAGELGLPAVIGAGEASYRHWSEARVLAIDCANKLVTVVR